MAQAITNGSLTSIAQEPAIMFGNLGVEQPNVQVPTKPDLEGIPI